MRLEIRFRVSSGSANRVNLSPASGPIWRLPGLREGAPQLDHLLAEDALAVRVAGGGVVDGHAEHVLDLVAVHHAGPRGPRVRTET